MKWQLKIITTFIWVIGASIVVNLAYGSYRPAHFVQAAPQPMPSEEELWDKAKAQRTEGALKGYLHRYPNGKNSKAAERLLNEARRNALQAQKEERQSSSKALSEAAQKPDNKDDQEDPIAEPMAAPKTEPKSEANSEPKSKPMITPIPPASNSSKPKPKKSTLNEFSWPPPMPSTFMVMDKRLFSYKSEDQTIGMWGQAIEQAIRRAGYYEYSWYQITGQNDGVVLATRMERIDKEARPFPNNERWVKDIKAPSKFSLGDYIKGLFYAEEGKYRIILFAITDEPFNFVKKSVKARQAKEWVKEGSPVLTGPVAQKKATAGHQVIALIYEFEKSKGDQAESREGSIMVIEASLFPAVDQLKKAGILTEDEPKK